MPSCKIAAPALPALLELPVVTDTVERFTVRERTVTDTLLIPGDTLVVTDSVPCPPGLSRDSLVYVTRRIQTPPRTVVVTRTVHDTLEMVEIRQVSPLDGEIVSGMMMLWGRISMGVLLLFLLFFILRHLFKRDKK